MAEKTVWEIVAYAEAGVILTLAGVIAKLATKYAQDLKKMIDDDNKSMNKVASYLKDVLNKLKRGDENAVTHTQMDFGRDDR